MSEVLDFRPHFTATTKLMPVCPLELIRRCAMRYTFDCIVPFRCCHSIVLLLLDFDLPSLTVTRTRNPRARSYFFLLPNVRLSVPAIRSLLLQRNTHVRRLRSGSRACRLVVADRVTFDKRIICDRQSESNRNRDFCI